MPIRNITALDDTKLPDNQLIHTKKQYDVSKKILEDIANAEEPAVLSDMLDIPVTTVKSFLKKLRDEGVLEVKSVMVDGEQYVAVNPVSMAFLLQPSKNWHKLKDEFSRIKVEHLFS